MGRDSRQDATPILCITVFLLQLMYMHPRMTTDFARLDRWLV